MTVGRPQTRAEELANAITHGLGLAASLAGAPLLVREARAGGDAWLDAGLLVFGATLVLMYLASTLYHAVPHARPKRVLRTIDHSAIFLLIAGTYTPFLLGPLRGPWGWWLLGVEWGLATLGVIAKWTVGFRFPRLSTAVYLAMGWSALVAIVPLARALSPSGLAWLVGGGLCYTGGVAFYATDHRLRYGHAVWHLFVAGGSVCHFVAVVGHAVPG
ncbi:hemolysin III family protein [Roseisolibacter sp. H3M3-2]|uniref:PAQR family membrane homeostasis protein TrhA n=1 Tax=Roseisolibacter sp. H3M3-2 TaxID=3031323 RepID=UPI0023DCB23E|nr:hemolysin III family protein [Roseisolibacter sp. H3M3-2]MDF1501936.1 hemolysin III family protein [Roseisolibacter sp. H3M3-2]